MSISDRLADADLLWTYGRREGALLSLLVATEPVARREHPGRGSGEPFRKFIDGRLPYPRGLRYRGADLTVGELMWKWMRCKLADDAALPQDLRFFDTDNDPDDLRIELAGPRDNCVRISDGWYWWLRRQIEDVTVREAVQDLRARTGRTAHREEHQQ